MRHSATIKHFRFVIEGEEMRNVYTFAGLTFALVLAFSLTTAAQTSSTGSKQQSSPDQSQTDSAGNMHRDWVGERLEWLSQQLNLTEDQRKQLKPILAGEFKQMRAEGEDASLTQDQYLRAANYLRIIGLSAPRPSEGPTDWQCTTLALLRVCLLFGSECLSYLARVSSWRLCPWVPATT